MKKHRRLLWSLGLCALMGLMAGEARAVSISMTISTNGHSFTVGGGQVTSSTSTALNINTANLNTALSGFGSAYQFSGSLGGSSNWAGSTAGGGFLTLTGTLTEGGTGTHLGPIVITVSETGFTAPPIQTGMQESAVANYTNTTAGDNQSATGTYNVTSLTLGAALMTSTGPALNNYSPKSSMVVAGTGAYNLSESVTINMAANANSPTDGFSGSVKVTGTAIPEPASVVMFMTGMPLPLVLVGLLRRRRRAVAQG
jgi:hypothetical protein